MIYTIIIFLIILYIYTIKNNAEENKIWENLKEYDENREKYNYLKNTNQYKNKLK